ncbi:pyridoxal phosphate-dependent transferase [Suillus subalutaceus]|uniref:pyridoxal phosphate-dependent transferase n=1 Tax=Suillus subalutaceus TaxID=48586 RepID=UPI001B866BBA|nr:pyridoxal phosphate-dependent transferase [Suillus subalutaceus]KAG1843799.1 pyridoxal phosphate-dependent transferase [Suillus subalutaceus]
MEEPQINSNGTDNGDIDLSHHLSDEARNRVANPLKDIIRVISECPVIDLISMANGDPHHSLYPFRQIMYEVPSVQDAPDPVTSWRNNSGLAQIIRSYKDKECALSIRDAFPYSRAAGLQQCIDVLTDFTKLMFAPPNHHVMLTLGNSDGITKVFRLFGEKGDHFLTDEFSFPSMTNSPLAYGVKWVGVKMDPGGIIPEELERILAKWDEVKSGRRPRVLYIVPVGQNPTGSTLTVDRRKKIYAIAQRWDLIIMEDDPYYFLQYDIPQTNCASTDPDEFIKNFRSTLIPTFLSMDVDGRVLRIDTFSKVLAPGMRLGWITSNKLFHQKLADYTDSSTQPPHAFGQMFVTEMLSEHGWKVEGFCRWLKSLRMDYQSRRDFLLDVFSARRMFVWIEVFFERHPRFVREQYSGGSPVVARTNTEQLLKELFERLMNTQGVVFIPSSTFAIPENPLWVESDGHVPLSDRNRFLRATFAGTEDIIEKGMIRLGNGLREFFQD